MTHERHLRNAFELARRSRGKGNHPFGAVLVAPGGEIVLEAENTVVSDKDRTAHAEMNLLRRASKLGSEAELAGYTLYVSTEPCIMCAGAAYWAGIGTIVYGLPKQVLDELVGHDPSKPSIAYGARTVLKNSLRPVAIVGPLLEDEARQVHEGFWRKKS